MRVSGLLWSVVWGALAGAVVGAEDETLPPTSQLDAAAKKVAAKTYDLRYKFQAGETLRWKVSHLATTQTKIQGNTQTSQARSLSTKAWKVTDVDQHGNITFVHTVEDVDMWQKVDDRPEVQYNSRRDKKPPLLYEATAATVGVPLATLTIDPHGKIIERESQRPNGKFGLGQITMPLPEQPVRIGTAWYLPDQIHIRLEDQRVKRVKIRLKYKLTDVRDDVATIKVDTEVLSVINDAAERSQLVQQLTHGSVRFDIEAGRVIGQRMDWDETVIGFSSNDSIMHYVARFTEDLVPTEARTAKNAPLGPFPDQPE